MPDAAIDIQNASKSFGRTQAVRNLDLAVPQGSVCGFLGPNGAGKSTTIRMIMSIIYPDEGSISVLGSDALHNKDRIGYLPEERGLYRKMRVADYLLYIAKLKEVNRAEAKRRIRDWLERIDLPDVERKKCEELSKGMQQKVQFLAAIIHDPDLLILDEPFSGLDPVNSQLLNHIIREMNAAGKTIIFSTHVLHQAELICDRIFLIHKGVKLLDATLDEIRARFDPRTIVVEPLTNGEAHGDQLNGHTLQSIAGVTGVHPIQDSPQLELALSDNADAQAIMREVIALAPMRTVERRRLTLDEVFIRLVKRGAGQEAAEIAREELSHV